MRGPCALERRGHRGLQGRTPPALFRLPESCGDSRREQPGFHLTLSVLSPAPLRCLTQSSQGGGPRRVSTPAPSPPRLGWGFQVLLWPSGRRRVPLSHCLGIWAGNSG